MQKNINYYLPLYRQCEVQIKNNKTGKTAKGSISDNDYFNLCFLPHVEAKLLLRHLSSMSTQEMRNAEAVYFEAIKQHGRGVLAYAKITNWYRDNGFDIDSLIAEGIAIQP